MLKFAANLSWLFQEYPFLDRFAAAADAGFEAVEFLFPYDFDADTITQRLARHNLKPVLFNAAPGNFAAGERGIAAFPERAAELRAAVQTALHYARITGTPRLHLMSGIGAGDTALAAYRQAILFACEAAARDGIEIVIEPINNRDIPGYLMNSFDLAAQLIADLGLPNLKLQFDIYHRQIIHGDVLRGLETLMPVIGHIQIAAAPLRQEPGSGELDDARVLRAIKALGYAGHVGCEYKPAAGTVEGLGWITRLTA